MELHEYFQEVKEPSLARRDVNWRKGQAAFNLLVEVRPDLSEQIRGGNNDPFYHSAEHGNWDRFIAFIRSNW